MLTTIAWELADGTVAYALEGAIFVTGAAIQWLRDGIHVIDTAAEAGALAESVSDSGGVYVVPAFTGLGSPWWDPYARGTILGITRGSTKAHITRAVVESMAYQTRDAIDAMVKASGTPITDLRVDGGASVMDFLLQMQADQLGVPVQRPKDQETTALGAAYLAGLAEGIWDLDAIRDTWQLDATFDPADGPHIPGPLPRPMAASGRAQPRLGEQGVAMTDLSHVKELVALDHGLSVDRHPATRPHSADERRQRRRHDASRDRRRASSPSWPPAEPASSSTSAPTRRSRSWSAPDGSGRPSKARPS